MRSTLTVLLLLSVFHQPLLRAEKTTLGNVIDRAAARMIFLKVKSASAQTPQSPTQDRSWIARHPVVFGTLVRAGAGAISSIPQWTELYCATGGDEDCLFHGGAGVLFGACAGAGIGALIGFLVGHD
jgi:hypothetical protein